MDCHVFRRLCDELAPALMGCRIEKIHRPAKDVTLFTLYGTGGKRFLFIRAGRKAPFLSFRRINPRRQRRARRPSGSGGDKRLNFEDRYQYAVPQSRQDAGAQGA